MKCLRLHICVLYNVIVLTDKVLIVHLNLHLDVSEETLHGKTVLIMSAGSISVKRQFCVPKRDI